MYLLKLDYQIIEIPNYFKIMVENLQVDRRIALEK